MLRYLHYLVFLLVPAIATADGLNLSSKSRNILPRSQLDVLDARQSARFSTPVELRAPRIIIPGAPLDFETIVTQPGPYLAAARAAAQANNIPQDLFLRLIRQESGWNPRAVSPKGAIGLAQLMPATALKLRVDPYAPSENLNGGARYLRLMYNRFGSWELALAAYNAGPDAVSEFNGIPPYAETRNYVKNIMENQ